MNILDVYDNGDKTCDQYTIVFDIKADAKGKYFLSLGMSNNPTSPNGFAQFGECILGNHLGRRIQFEELPRFVQEYVKHRIN